LPAAGTEKGTGGGFPAVPAFWQRRQSSRYESPDVKEECVEVGFFGSWLISSHGLLLFRADII
jgi:hypothetical protein